MTAARHAHELEESGDVRWSARVKDGLVFVKDAASGEEVQATAYTDLGTEVKFQLPGDNGLRCLKQGDPGFEAFKKALAKSPSAAPAATSVATAVPVGGTSAPKKGE